MKDRNVKNELQLLMHIVLIITLIIFSVAVITFNVMLDWENWPIPFVAGGVFVALSMHIMHKPDENARRYIYSAMLLAELFYYSVNVVNIYDTTPVAVVLLMIFSIAGEKLLTGICVGVSLSGMIYHVIMSGSRGVLQFQVSNVLRTVWHFALLIISGIIAVRLADLRKKSDAAYIERIKHIEAENESATDFLANVSHEIRTPINAVIGLTNVMLSKEVSDDIREDMLAVDLAGHRIADQISDILDFSEIDIGRLKNNYETYMISSVLNDLVLRLRPVIENDLELVIDVETTVPAMLISDVSKIRKILWHLITNGIKYTKKGGVYVRISSIKQKYGINLFIEVTDTGIGMAEEELERICERFYQANSGRTRSTSGLGLGLPITAGFVRSLGGFMTVKSEKGVGTTVYVSIPHEVADSSECMSVREPDRLCLGGFLHFEKFEVPQVREFYNSMIKHLVQGLGTNMHRVENIRDLESLAEKIKMTHLFVGEEEYLSAPERIERLARKLTVVIVCSSSFTLPRTSRAKLMPKPFYCFPVVSILNMELRPEEQEDSRLMCRGVSALVVDDEPMNLTVARGILGRYGITVYTAASGAESVEKCTSSDYDLVFMDHMMPEMDGIEAMKLIRMNIGSGKMKIIALTANAASSAKEMFLNEGFDGFVSKPIEIVELERVLKQSLPPSMISYESSLTEEPAPDAEGPEPAEEITVPEKSAFDLLEEGGIDSSAGLEYCQGDEEFYFSLLEQFADEYPAKSGKLTEFLENKDMHNYAILVHSLKSTAKMIGASALSERALGLETAAKEEDLGFVSDGHRPMLELFSETVSTVSAACEKKQSEKGGDEK